MATTVSDHKSRSDQVCISSAALQISKSNRTTSANRYHPNSNRHNPTHHHHLNENQENHYHTNVGIPKNNNNIILTDYSAEHTSAYRRPSATSAAVQVNRNKPQIASGLTSKPIDFKRQPPGSESITAGGRHSRLMNHQQNPAGTRSSNIQSTTTAATMRKRSIKPTEQQQHSATQPHHHLVPTGGETTLVDRKIKMPVEETNSSHHEVTQTSWLPSRRSPQSSSDYDTHHNTLHGHPMLFGEESVHNGMDDARSRNTGTSSSCDEEQKKPSKKGWEKGNNNGTTTVSAFFGGLGDASNINFRDTTQNTNKTLSQRRGGNSNQCYPIDLKNPVPNFARTLGNASKRSRSYASNQSQTPQHTGCHCPQCKVNSADRRDGEGCYPPSFTEWSRKYEHYQQQGHTHMQASEHTHASGWSRVSRASGDWGVITPSDAEQSSTWGGSVTGLNPIRSAKVCPSCKGWILTQPPQHIVPHDHYVMLGDDTTTTTTVPSVSYGSNNSNNDLLGRVQLLEETLLELKFENSQLNSTIVQLSVENQRLKNLIQKQRSMPSTPSSRAAPPRANMMPRGFMNNNSQRVVQGSSMCAGDSSNGEAGIHSSVSTCEPSTVGSPKNMINDDRSSRLASGSARSHESVFPCPSEEGHFIPQDNSSNMDQGPKWHLKKVLDLLSTTTHSTNYCGSSDVPQAQDLSGGKGAALLDSSIAESDEMMLRYHHNNQGDPMMLPQDMTIDDIREKLSEVPQSSFRTNAKKPVVGGSRRDVMDNSHQDVSINRESGKERRPEENESETTRPGTHNTCSSPVLTTTNSARGGGILLSDRPKTTDRSSNNIGCTATQQPANCCSQTVSSVSSRVDTNNNGGVKSLTQPPPGDTIDDDYSSSSSTEFELPPPPPPPRSKPELHKLVPALGISASVVGSSQWMTGQSTQGDTYVTH